jgi:hypothetical protein
MRGQDGAEPPFVEPHGTAERCGRRGKRRPSDVPDDRRAKRGFSRRPHGTARRKPARRPVRITAGEPPPRPGRATASAGEPPPKPTSFITVSAEELRGQREADDTSLKQWIIVGVLAVVAAAIIGLTVFLTHPSPLGRHAIRPRDGSDGRGERPPGTCASWKTTWRASWRAIPTIHGPAKCGLIRTNWNSSGWSAVSSAGPGGAGGVEGLMPVERAYLEAIQKSATDPQTATREATRAWSPCMTALPIPS